MSVLTQHPFAVPVTVIWSSACLINIFTDFSEVPIAGYTKHHINSAVLNELKEVYSGLQMLFLSFFSPTYDSKQQQQQNLTLLPETKVSPVPSKRILVVIIQTKSLSVLISGLCIRKVIGVLNLKKLNIHCFISENRCFK